MIRRAIPFIIAGIILVGIFVALLLYTPSGPPEGNVRRVYFADNISAVHQLAIDRFNAEHRGTIEVVPVNLPFSKFSTNERKELLARSLRSRSDRLDVFSVDLIWVPRFSKWCEHLDGRLDSVETRSTLPYALESCFYGGHLLALPLYIDVGLLYYRRDLIQRLPDADSLEARLKRSITWDEFIALRNRLDLQGAPYYLFQADNFEGLVCNYFELLVGQRRDFFRANRVDLESAEAERALQMLVDFVHRYEMSPPRVAEFDEIRSYIHMLRTGGAFVRGWPNFLENYRSFYPDSVDISRIGRAALPHFQGHEPVSVFGGWNLMISEYSAHKEDALTFIRYLRREDTQKMLFELGGYIPTNSAVYADTAFMARHPDLTYYRQLLDRGFHRPQLQEYTRLSDIISYYANLAIKGELTVHEALTRASRAIRGDTPRQNSGEMP